MFLCSKLAEFFAGSNVPSANRLVEPHGDQGLAVRRKDDGCDDVLMPNAPPGLLPRRHLPETHHLAVSRRCQPSSVGGKRESGRRKHLLMVCQFELA